MLTVRLARDGDAEAFRNIVGAAWTAQAGEPYRFEDWTPEWLAPGLGLAQRGGTAWAAETGGRVVGVAAGWPAGEAWELDKLYVDPSHQGHGAGASLLAICEVAARGASARTIRLWSDSRLVRAHGFYEKHSFVRGLLRAEDGVDLGFDKPLSGTVVRRLDAAGAQSAQRRLTEILVGCVDGGAAVSFLPPLGRAVAGAFWRGVVREVAAGTTLLLAAWQDGVLAGTVQLRGDTPPNQPHRAEMAKLLVDPRLRRHGVGRALMAAAEDVAGAHGRTLLTLDTRADDGGEALYRSMGWVEAGRIPGYAKNPDGTLHDTVLFWKQVATASRKV